MSLSRILRNGVNVKVANAMDADDAGQVCLANLREAYGGRLSAYIMMMMIMSSRSVYISPLGLHSVCQAFGNVFKAGAV